VEHIYKKAVYAPLNVPQCLHTHWAFHFPCLKFTKCPQVIF